jgi:Trypsin
MQRPSVQEEVSQMMRKKFGAVLGLVAALALAAPTAAVTNGHADNGEHPYVGELLFYIPDAVDSRFDTPGSWFSCTGTLLNSATVITAGHCTFGIGLDGVSTTNNGAITTAALGGYGGDDVWINFNAAPNFSILSPSSGFVPGGNQARYLAWSAALNASPDWHRGISHPQPQFDDKAFSLHDAGIVTLASAVPLAGYGTAAGLDYLDKYRAAPRNAQRFEVVGYGLTKVLPIGEWGGDTRMQAEPKLDTINPRNPYIVLSNNAATGGTCYGDSGGPTFDNTDSNMVVAVTSFGISPNCTGIGGAYRLDQPEVQAFLASYGVTP